MATLQEFTNGDLLYEKRQIRPHIGNACAHMDAARWDAASSNREGGR